MRSRNHRFTPARRAGDVERRLSYERRILLLAVLAGLPGSVFALAVLWGGGYQAKVQWTLTLWIVLWGLGFLYALRERIVFPLQTLANLLEALREGDYTLRARWAGRQDSLGEVMEEVNALGMILRSQRLGAVEATALLTKVMDEIEVAVFAFDHEDTLQLVNRAGERLLSKPAVQLIGRRAHTAGLAECLTGAANRTLQHAFPGGVGRWGMRRSQFRQEGRSHQLLVLTDLSRALREEERQAWQRLIRVLGHELNNSLAPIRSMASTLSALIQREPPPADWQEDMRRGLGIVAERSESLSRFMTAYSRLARLPEPTCSAVNVATWIGRVAQLDGRLKVRVEIGPAMVIQADKDQLDQLLINLVRNAIDAALETGGDVTIGWRRVDARLEVRIEDEGPGLTETTNLFVPFYTTKPSGSGIGLVLSRQIAEAHGGSLVLRNRDGGRGCEALLVLPCLVARPHEPRHELR